MPCRRRLKGEELPSEEELSTYGVQTWAGKRQNDLSAKQDGWVQATRSTFQSAASRQVLTELQREEWLKWKEARQAEREGSEAYRPSREATGGRLKRPSSSSCRFFGVAWP